MPAPLNTSAATAFDLGSFPVITTQQVDDAGTTFEVWWKFTATAGQNMAGIFPFGGATSGGYEPTITIWTGPLGSLVQLLGISVRNKPVQFPVTPGTIYYLKFTPNGNFTPSNLTIDAKYGPLSIIRTGAILVNDDTAGFPAAVLSSVNNDDYNVVGFIQGITAGEAGEALDVNNKILLSDNTVNNNLKLYNQNLQLLLQINPGFTVTDDTRLTANQVTGRFYVGTPGANALIAILDRDGAVLDNQTLPGTGLRGLAASLNDTILYVVNSASATNAPVQRWDLVNEVMLSNLVAGIANYATKDIIVLKDGSILVAYNRVNAVPPDDIVIKRYDSSGATLNTYTSTGNVVSQIIATALDNPTSFWLWTHDQPVAGISRFKNIRVSDGVVLSEIEQVEYELGQYNAAETATPIARFGNSFSCPFLILRGSPGITVTKVTNPANATVFNFTTTGLDPSTFQLSNGQSRQFTGLIPGTYGITEIEQAGYITTYNVSNGNPPNAIVLGENEQVTVIVTNTITSISGIYKIQPGKRNDTLYQTLNPVTTQNVKIPNPKIRSALLG